MDSKWIKNESDAQAAHLGYWFDQTAADKCRKFIETFCKQSIGKFAGQPLKLLPYQFDEIIAPMEGWKKPNSKEKRFRQISVWLPKNSGKTTLSAAVCLWKLAGLNQAAAQVIQVASTKEQAGICYNFASAMVDQSPELEKRLWCRSNIKTIQFKEQYRNNSELRVMSGDDGKKGKRGFPIFFLLVDELAEQQNRVMLDTMYANVKKIDSAQMLTISTAGYKRESIGFEQFQYAAKVKNSQIVDLHFLPVVYCASASEDWTSLETYKKCNPSWQVSSDLDEVAGTIQECLNEPRKAASYKTERLNLWTGFSTQFISNEKWSACKTPFQESEFYGSTVFVGLDAARVHDLFCYVITAERDNKLYLMPRFFIPKAMAQQKQERDKVPYLAWAESPDNHLYLTPGDVIDPQFIRQQLKEDNERFRIVELGYDPKFMEDTRQYLEADIGIKMVSVSQKPSSLGAAASFFERSVMAKTLAHNNPILDWCVSNTAAKETADGLFLFKASDTQRIDGTIATVISLHRYLAREQRPDGAKYVETW